MRVTTASAAPRQLRAIKVIRVSRQGKRATERFVSPEDQRRDIDRLAGGQNWMFVAEFEERNVSGYSVPLEKRKGLYPAMLMVERGEADVIVFGYRDRMARNNLVEDVFLGRVGTAGGQVWAADFGQIKTDTAVERLTSGFLGLVQRYVSDSVRDKTAGPKARAVELGVPPFPNIPPGYRQDPQTRTLVVHEDEAKLIRRVYEMRQEGTSLIEIRDYLRAHGIHRSWRGTQEILKNRIYLGELHFGKLSNLASHQAIIEPALFRTIQKMRVRRGKKPVSTSLFARQGLVRCSECGSRMVIGQQTKLNRDGERVVYRDYRCSPTGDCPRRQTIGAQLLEDYVVSEVRNAQAEGRWSPSEQLAAARADLDAVERELTALATTFSSVADVPGIAAKIAGLREDREVKRERVNALLVGDRAARVGTLASRWDSATLDEQRTALRLLIETVTVSPGKGTGRIYVKFF